ncbi:MAG: glycosyltransferase [bacterium]|nr:glycosyltransferase [bacterium]MDT8365277.1 glycosyltransferase [bacterium]
MKRPIRILHVETGRNLYGGALQVHYLLRGLANRKNVESTLVCPEGSAIAEAAREYVDELYTVPMKGDLDLLFIPRLRTIIRKESPDIIHLHSRRGADVLGGIAARLSGTRCIITRRVDNPENRLWASVKYRLYHHVVTISEGIRDVLISEGVPPEKITCVHSAVDAGLYNQDCDREWFYREFGLKKGSRVCGTVAQFIERKGHRFLLAAVPEILKKVPKARFLFFGKGPLERPLRSLCRDLGIENQVLFTGFRNDLERVFGCLDLVIHPALMEGLGVSLLQAAAAGVPILSTRVGGIPEIVHDGVNGCLIPPGDVPSLVEAAVRVLMDRELAQRLGKGGRKVIEEHFSIESMVEGNLRVYYEMAGEPRHQA